MISATTLRPTKRLGVAGGALLAALALSLTGCSGQADGDGIYYGSFDGRGAMEIKDGTVTWYGVSCADDTAIDDPVIGQLNEDRTTVVWVEGGTDSITFIENGLSIDGETLFVKGSDQGDVKFADIEEGCANTDGVVWPEGAPDK